jgi:transcription elongation factor Elf1
MEDDTIYARFVEDYDKKHALCPKCGSPEHSSTLEGYIFDIKKPGEYQDLNICECSNCGFECTCHERISKEDFIKREGWKN